MPFNIKIENRFFQEVYPLALNFTREKIFWIFGFFYKPINVNWLPLPMMPNSIAEHEWVKHR
jgi:hypothetical protein